MNKQISAIEIVLKCMQTFHHDAMMPAIKHFRRELICDQCETGFNLETKELWTALDNGINYSLCSLCHREEGYFKKGSRDPRYKKLVRWTSKRLQTDLYRDSSISGCGVSFNIEPLTLIQFPVEIPGERLLEVARYWFSGAVLLEAAGKRYDWGELSGLGEDAPFEPDSADLLSPWGEMVRCNGKDITDAQRILFTDKVFGNIWEWVPFDVSTHKGLYLMFSIVNCNPISHNYRKVGVLVQNRYMESHVDALEMDLDRYLRMQAKYNKRAKENNRTVNFIRALCIYYGKKLPEAVTPDEDDETIIKA
jgi:hypothetical protein